MAAAVGLWRASTPHSIDDDLAALWREAGAEGPVSRALMSNLVVVSARREFPGVEDVARRHPARTILLSYRSEVEQAPELDEIRVGVVTFGEAGARYGLEFIAVRTACSHDALPSIVRRLTIGSVPTSVWWTADLNRPTPPGPLCAIGRQLVYDSATWQDVKGGLQTASELLRQPQPPDLADLNWRRLAPLRAAIVHALSPDEHFAPATVEAVVIAHGPGELAAASLMSGWLSARLGVTAGLEQRGKDEDGASDDQRADDARQGDERLSIRMVADGSPLLLSMTTHQITVTGQRPAFVVPVPAETEADAIATELLSLSPDPGLRDALAAIDAGPR